MRPILFVLVAALAAAGCYQRHGLGDAPDARVLDDAGARDGGARRDAGDEPPPATRDLDLLFVIDDSISMEEEQASLVAELPRLVHVLATGDFDLDGDGVEDGEPGDDDFRPPREIHAAVITTDMGSGGHRIPTCGRAAFGDDGIFRERSLGIPSCMTVYPPFLRFEPGRRDPLAFASDLMCVGVVGTDGCGIEQPLEAALKALSFADPASGPPGYVPPVFHDGTSGHGDGTNAGFLHPNGVLAVVVLSDDDDCSPADAGFFDPDDPDFEPGLNLRCSRNEDRLQPLARYVDGFLQLGWRAPERFVFAPIVGVPTDLVPAAGARIDYDAILDDDRMQRRLDPDDSLELLPSCEVPGRGLAYPPVRLLRAARALESRGATIALSSICHESFREVVAAIASRL